MEEITGEIALARRGLAALELLKELGSDAAEVTAGQREILAGWTGWGPLAKTLIPRGQVIQGWEDLTGRVRELLSDTERDTARNACDTAFYTPATVVRGMWDLVTGLGFTGGRALEPGCGRAGSSVLPRPALTSSGPVSKPTR